MAEWLLVFVFHTKGVFASGPHDLETCKVMLAAQPGPAACVHKDRPQRRAAERSNNTPKE